MVTGIISKQFSSRKRQGYKQWSVLIGSLDGLAVCVAYHKWMFFSRGLQFKLSFP